MTKTIRIHDKSFNKKISSPKIMLKFSQLITNRGNYFKAYKSLRTICNNKSSQSFKKNIITKNQAKKHIKMEVDNLESVSNKKTNACAEELKRSWKNTLFGEQPAKHSGFQFIFMSYNILSQGLLESHPNLYRDHTEEFLEWNYRLEKIIEEINDINPQLLCLQEVEQIHLEKISNNLKNLNFEMIFKKRTGEKIDGCAIFYNKNLFELLESHSVEYYQPHIEVLNRENVAIIVILGLKSDPNVKLVIANTHLLYNPRRQNVRLAQIQVLLAELDRVSHNGLNKNGTNRYLPTIVAGDFNLQPSSAPYKLFTSGYLEYQNSNSDQKNNIPLPSGLQINDNCQHNNVRKKTGDQTKLYHSELNAGVKEETLKNKEGPSYGTGSLRHQLNLSSVNVHNSDQKMVDATTHQNEWLITDYIFYSKWFNPKFRKITEGSLKLISRYALPSIEECKAIGRIPNASIGSDHFSLAAKFILQTPKKNRKPENDYL